MCTIPAFNSPDCQTAFLVDSYRMQIWLCNRPVILCWFQSDLRVTFIWNHTLLITVLIMRSFSELKLYIILICIWYHSWWVIIKTCSMTESQETDIFICILHNWAFFIIEMVILIKFVHRWEFIKLHLQCICYMKLPNQSGTIVLSIFKYFLIIKDWQSSVLVFFFFKLDGEPKCLACTVHTW